MNPLKIFAKRFIAGDRPEEAIKAVRELNKKGITATLDILGESVTDKDKAIKAADDYISLLDLITKENVDSNVSLKLTQMGLGLDYNFCFGNVKRVVEKAKTNYNFVRIDMEGSAHTEKTLSLFDELLEEYHNVGVVIQAYLHRSGKDIEKIVKNGCRVRLCKGAYKEPPTIAFADKKEVNKNYIELMEKLLLEGNNPAIATHDEKIINYAKKFVEENNLSKSSFEFQMLYGIRRDLQLKLVDEGYKMRVYVPFGTHWLPYTVRRLRERKENFFFVLKNILKP